MSDFTESSPWQDWVDFCREVDSRREDFDPDEGRCPITSWGRSLGDVSFADALHGASGDAAVRACHWFAINVWGDVPSGLKATMLAIIAQEPPVAAITYQHGTALTADERLMLWQAFAEHMPVTRNKMIQRGEMPNG